MGIVLSRATMANWTIKCADDYITPVVDRMKELLLKRDILHADETPVQVLKEPGKKPQTKSYMWLYRTGNDGDVPISCMTTGRQGPAITPKNTSKDSAAISTLTDTPVTANLQILPGVAAGLTLGASLMKPFRSEKRRK